MKKTWQEKMMDKPGVPKIIQLQYGFPCYNALHKMGAEAGDDIVLVNAREVESLMKRVPAGKLVTLVEICRHLAGQYQVKGCCTLTAGIFTMTAANAAAERGNKIGPDFVPYWRTLKSGGELNAKYPGSIESHAALLQAEGFVIIHRGRRAFVKDFQNYLYVF